MADLSRHRPRHRAQVWIAYALALGLTYSLTNSLLSLDAHLALASHALLFVVLVAMVAMIGGVGPALLCAVLGAAALTRWFVPPYGSWRVDSADDVVTLVVFVVVAGVVGGLSDLAARRTDQAAVAAAEARALDQVDRTRTALLAAVGHDLRTPLAAAKAAVGTLRSAGLPLTDSDRAELLEAADDSLDRLAALVADLLDTSRLQAGAMPASPQPVGVAEVCARAVDDVAAGERVVLEPTEESLVAQADPGFLERVLVNLLDNAVRHSPEGRPVRVTARRVGPHVEVRVVDRGPGVPADRREDVFAPFQRLGDTDAATGVGLGLALSRGLTEAMGGTLQAEDTPGGGLTMVVRLDAAAWPEDARPGRRERSAP